MIIRMQIRVTSY